MTITLLLVGKTDNAQLQNLVTEYQNRLSHFVNYKVDVIPDLKKISTSDFLVLLDDKGTEFTSLRFSNWIQKRMNSGLKQLVFVIGGPYGFSEAVYKRANQKVSLSKMTFSHQMIRLFFTEQLYRAFSILNNLPYHHE